MEAEAYVPCRKGNGLTVFDTLLVCILIAGMLAGFMSYYGRMIQAARETALRTGLANIRLSIQLYYGLNSRYPADLKELLSKRYLMPSKDHMIFSDQYLQAQAMDQSGYPVDSFGQRYHYNPVLGRVSSGTKGYENW